MSVALNTISCATKIKTIANGQCLLNFKGRFCNVILSLKLHSFPANFTSHRLHEYMNLKHPEEKCTARYVWIDSTGITMRTKTKVLDFIPEVVCQLPVWSYDGSSTGQAKGENSDVYLVPVAMYPDPFRGGDNKIVLCETYDHEKKPTPTNNRKCCFESMEKVADQKPWFGIEQEYTMMNTHPNSWPHGWPTGYPAPQGKNKLSVGYPGPQGPYYCGVGAGKVFGREIVEAHLRACLYCGINLSGINAEVMPSQWEFQVGPTEGIAAADEVWMARFLLSMIAEECGVDISFDPKPVQGDWNGAGGHVNFSTEKMREDGGMKEIEKCMKKLEKNHLAHIKVYDPRGGEDNKRRLTGLHETSSMEKFTWAVANRGVSVRITREVNENKKGYFEDRRPSANADPYSVCNALVCTCLL